MERQRNNKKGHLKKDVLFLCIIKSKNTKNKDEMKKTLFKRLKNWYIKTKEDRK